METTLILGAILEQSAIASSTRKGDDGSFQLEVSSYHSDRAKTIRCGPARLVTNVPRAIVLGGVENESGGDHRQDVSWTTIYRKVVFGEMPPGGFVAYVTDRSSSGCQYVGGKYIVPLAGEVPILDFGTAYVRWAEGVEDEALTFLRGLAASQPRRVQHSLEFASGRAHYFAPHAQRRTAWGAALRGLGLKGPAVDKIATGSVRTATAKAALSLGWQPSVAKPAYWEGLPKGVVEIGLEMTKRD